MTQITFAQIPLELIRYVRSCKLTGTQYNLWLYIYEIDPFGDRWQEIPSPAQIASEFGVNERTIERAAQRLRDLRLIDFEIKTWRWRNSSKSFQPEPNFPCRTKRSNFGQKDPNVENGIKRSNFGQKDPQIGSKDPNQPPEPLQNGRSEVPHTIKTYLDFKDSLSEEERAKFLNFCKEKISNLKQEVNDIEAWLAHRTAAGQNRWEVYYQKFKESKEKPAKRPISEPARQFQEWQKELEERRLRVERKWAEERARKAAQNQNDIETVNEAKKAAPKENDINRQQNEAGGAT